MRRVVSEPRPLPAATATIGQKLEMTRRHIRFSGRTTQVEAAALLELAESGRLPDSYVDPPKKGANERTISNR